MRSRVVAAAVAFAVVDGAATAVLDDRPGTTTLTAADTAAEFLRATGAAIPSPDPSTTAMATTPARIRGRKRAKKDPSNSKLGTGERRAWRDTHHGAVEGSDTPSAARRRLGSGDGDSSGTGSGPSDNDGDDDSDDIDDGDDIDDDDVDGSDKEHVGSACETDDALDPTKVCVPFLRFARVYFHRTRSTSTRHQTASRKKQITSV